MERNNIIDPLQTLKRSGKPVIGCFPLYPPVEFMHAMGLVPVVLWGLRGMVRQTAESDKHLQPYVCSVARHLTEFLLSEGKDLVDGIFMYNACDTLRNLPEIFMNEFSGSGREVPLIRMHIPMAPQQQTHSAEYFENEIRSVIQTFEDHFRVSLSRDKFAESLLMYSRLRKLAIRAEADVAAGFLSFSSFARTMREGWFLPVEDQIRNLESLGVRAHRQSDGPAKQQSKTGVILSGILPPPESMISAIEAAGLTVVGNDIASMHRAYADIHETQQDPVEYYKKFYLEHFPCPTLLYTSDRRLRALTDLIDRTGAKGVIFVGEKFCEYEYFEFPYLDKKIKEKGIQTLQLEISIEDQDSVAAQTGRIEAFGEMVK